MRAAVGVNDGVRGDHAGENSPGLVISMDEDALGINDGGRDIFSVNT